MSAQVHVLVPSIGGEASLSPFRELCWRGLLVVEYAGCQTVSCLDELNEASQVL